MLTDAIGHLKRHAKRVGEVASVLVKYGLADWLTWLKVDWIQNRLRSSDGSRLHDHSFEARVRLALMELGTTYTKLGQVLSTRPDVVGPALAEELSHLQANTLADAPAVARAALIAELGGPPEELFASFESEAFASASIAQVHRATLHSGETVVLKLMRAGVKQQAETDLEILAVLAHLLEERTTLLRPYQPTKLVREFQHTLRNELRFTHERRNLEQFERSFAGDPTVRFPKVYGEFCTERVLTMQYLDGVSAADADAVRATGIAPSEFARRGANVYLEMIFRDGFYHADPHPGNLLVLGDGRVGVLDCGMVGRVDDELRANVEAMLLAAVERDGRELCEMVFRIATVPANIDRRALQDEIEEFLGDYVQRDLADLEVGTALRRLFGIIRRYQIALPSKLSLLLRTIIVLEGTSRALDRDFSIAELFVPFYRRAVRRRFAPRRIWRRVMRSGRDWERLLVELPNDLQQLLEQLRAGTLRVQFEHRKIEASVNRLTLAMLVASLILASSALWASSAPPRIGEVSLLGLLGYLLAAWLGFRLWRGASKHVDR